MSTDSINEQIAIQLRDSIVQARARAKEQRHNALVGERNLLGNLRLLLGALGIDDARIMRNMVTFGNITLRAARPGPDEEPQLQLLGTIPDTNEESWSTYFTTLDQLADLLDTFQPDPASVSAKPISAAEQLAEAVRRVVRESQE